MPGPAPKTQSDVPSRRSVRYPGVKTTADGSEAVVYIESQLSQPVFAAPVPPSSRMTALFRREIAAGRTNLWDEKLSFLACEEEAALGRLLELAQA